LACSIWILWNAEGIYVINEINEINGVEDMDKVKVIRLHEGTYNRLRQYGRMGESFDSLVNRILNEYEDMKSKSDSDDEKKLSPEEVFGDLVNQEKQKPELWVEKYRPKKVDEMVGDPKLLKQLKSYITTRNVPNLLFYGPVGCGKTSAARCIVNEMYGIPGYGCLEYNAANLKKNDVRETIDRMAKRGSLVNIPYKICIIDECEQMTKDVESMLRTIMETYSNNIRFILVCNDITHKAISQPIKSRCTILEFKPPSKEDIYKRLSHIALKEHVQISEVELRAIAETAKGDVRKAINELQSRATVQEIG